MVNISDKIKYKLKHAPMCPGVYKMLDSRGNVIYISKSKLLNKRIKTYFIDNPKWDKVNKMLPFIDDIEFIVTDTHLEARLLECSMIKSIRPIFNSQMKHDRGYAYLKLEDYNRYRALSVSDSREENTYGPFRRRSYLSEIISAFKNLYPIKKEGNSCLFEYHLFPVTMNEHEFNENRIVLKEILSDINRSDLFVKALEYKMKKESSLNNFEMALLYRNMMEYANYLSSSVNKYNELINNRLLLSIPVHEGYKLFYIYGGKIINKKIYKELSPLSYDTFCEAAISAADVTPDVDEKSMIDFRDIIYSEILSLNEDMVKII